MPLFGGGGAIPGTIAQGDRSLDFDGTANAYLEIPIADLKNYSSTTLSVVLSCQFDATGSVEVIMAHHNGAGAGDKSFDFFRDTNQKVTFRIWDSSTVQGQLTTTATYTTATWYQFLFLIDTANATAGDRMKMFANGTEVTAFDTDTNPTTAIAIETSNVSIGGYSDGTSLLNGRVYMPAIYNRLLTVSEVYSGGPTDYPGNGLHSLLNTNSTDAITKDVVYPKTWTDNGGGVTKSATVP